MKQVLVLYYSKTGNTEKLAKEVVKGAESVNGVQCILKTTKQVTKEDFLNSDGIIAGSPVYFGTMAAELKRIFEVFIPIRRKMENKVGAAFCTSGFHTGGKETTMLSILEAMLMYGMMVVGDPLSATGHLGAACTGNPDKEAKDTALKLGRRVAQLVMR